MSGVEVWTAAVVHAYYEGGHEDDVPTGLVDAEAYDSLSTALASAIKERDEAYARVEVLEGEMRRYLPLLEFAEELPVWYAMTKGTGIATLNSYRAALSPELAKEPQS